MERGAEGWKLGERVAASVTGKTYVGEASWEMCLRSTKHQIFEMRTRGGDAIISVSELLWAKRGGFGLLSRCVVKLCDC
jgi:hypothetical protein